jgi:ribosomal-protein-alanine N-acetyltransferase
MHLPVSPISKGFTFREMAVEDAPQILEINTDEETRKYTCLLRQQTLSDIESWLSHYKHYQKYGYGLWALEDLHTKSLIGLCGLRVRKDLNNQTDISYRIHPAFRGKGVATAAIDATVRYGFEELKLRHILAQIHRGNKASLHLLEKRGFKAQSVSGNWIDLMLLNPG